MEINSYKVLTEPNWEYELVSGIIEENINKNPNEKLLPSIDSKEVKAILKNVFEYRNRVMEKVIPILDHYPEIKPFFEVSAVEIDNRARPLSLNLVSHQKLSRELTKDDIDAVMLEGFEDWGKAVNGEYSDIKITNLSELVDFVKGLESEDSVKIRIITLYSDRYTLIPKLQQFLAEGVNVLKEYYPIIKEEFERAVLVFEDKNYFLNNLDKFGFLKFEKSNCMILQPCIIPYNQIAVDWREEEEEEEEVVFTEVGLYVFRLFEGVKKENLSDSKILSGLKTLGDATRLKIIHMLSDEKMYVQQIADALSLTPATVSHHINLLLQEGFVLVTVDVKKAKKIYYEINRGRYKELGEAVMQLGTETVSYIE